MASFDPPPKFSFKAEEWRDWLADFKRFAGVIKLSSEAGETQRDTLIYHMGTRQAESIMQGFRWGKIRVQDPANNDRTIEVDETDTMFDVLIQKFTDHFVPAVNQINESLKFNKRVQGPSETVDQFVVDLQNLVKTCGYSDPERQVRDRFVAGLRDGRLQEKLQLTKNLTLVDAIEMSRRHEMVKIQVQQQQSQLKLEADYVRSGRGRYANRGRYRGSSKSQPRHHHANTQKTCDNCSKQHEVGKCPAKGKTCNYCHKRGHFIVCCKKRASKEARAREVVDDDVCDDVKVEDIYIGAVDCNIPEKTWTVPLEVAGKRIDFKIDTGADVSIISKDVYNSFSQQPFLKENHSRLVSPGGRLKTLGEFEATTNVKGTYYKFRIIVVDQPTNSLLSRSAASTMGFVARLDENELYGKTGLMKTTPVKIVLKPDAQPYCLNTARRVPFPIQKKVKEELDRMENDGIITRITKPTEWCAPMCPVVKKNGDIRICVDFKKLNQSVKRPHLMLPNLDDIAPKLSGSCIFSTLDISGGFFQVPLDSESASLTTFITPFGRYHFRRVPMGINIGPEEFQMKMQEKFGNLPGCEIIMDDMLIYGEDMKTHDARLKKVLDAVQEAGIKLNASKCHYRKTSVKFFGHVINSQGVQPDPEKIKAITELPAPTNITELRSLMGMLNYFSKFVDKLAMTMKPISDLLKSDTVFQWDSPQQEALEAVKAKLSEAPVLAFYRSDRPVIVSADASSYGIGGVLLQHDNDRSLRPVAYCSRTLTPSEKKWAQIEKENLASVWACEKFEKYLIGLPSFELWTDHKPLVPLMMTTDLDQAPVRCQRLLLRLMRFNPSVSHVPGKHLVIADALSRHPIPHYHSDECAAEEIEEAVDTLQALWPASSQRLQLIRTATGEDPELSLVLDYILHGWPRYLRDVPADLKPYAEMQSQLSIAEGIITLGDRIVIPSCLKEEMLSRLHESHQGITKTLENARSCLWWPGITKDIKATIENCLQCRENRPSQRKEPLKPSSLPDRPWSRVSADLCEYKGRHYLVVVDQYSRWIEIKAITNPSTAAVINRLKDIIATHGIFDELTSDNGPQFVSSEFHDFAKAYGFSQITSSPHFPQANGEAESAVKIAKKLLAQADPHLALLNYRSSVHSATKVSPAEALMGRRIQTRLPRLSKMLNPKTIPTAVIRKADESAKEKYKHYYDTRHGARELNSLLPGQQVMMKLDGEKTWSNPGVVLRSFPEGHTYTVQTATGIVRRNRNQLQDIPANHPIEPDPVVDPEPTSSSDTEQKQSESPIRSSVNSRVSSPQPPSFTPRRSGRVTTKPQRYIEQCDRVNNKNR